MKTLQTIAILVLWSLVMWFHHSFYEMVWLPIHCEGAPIRLEKETDPYFISSGSKNVLTCHLKNQPSYTLGLPYGFTLGNFFWWFNLN